MKTISKKKKIIIYIMISIMIITIVGIASTYAFFLVETHTTGKTEVDINADPIIDLTSNTLELSISPSKKGNEYLFSVEIVNGEEVTNASMQYDLEFQSLGNLPLEFELYEQSDEEEVNNLLVENGKATNVLRLNSEKYKTEYKLKVNWKENSNSYLYSETIDYVKIILESSQA